MKIIIFFHIFESFSIDNWENISGILVITDDIIRQFLECSLSLGNSLECIYVNYKWKVLKRVYLLSVSLCVLARGTCSTSLHSFLLGVSSTITPPVISQQSNNCHVSSNVAQLALGWSSIIDCNGAQHNVAHHNGAQHIGAEQNGAQHTSVDASTDLGRLLAPAHLKDLIIWTEQI